MKNKSYAYIFILALFEVPNLKLKYTSPASFMSAFTLLGLPAEIYTQVIDSVLEYLEGGSRIQTFRLLN